MPAQVAQQPSVAELIDFALFAGNREAHAVYAWLRGLQLYQRAEQAFAESDYFRSMSPGLPGPRGIPMQAGLQDSERLDFAQRVAYCIARYEIEKQSGLWHCSTSRNRSAAAKDYKRALRRVREGLGPQSAADRVALEDALAKAIRTVGGEDVPAGFKLKGGADRAPSLLIRELGGMLSGSFTLRRPTLTAIIRNIVAIADDAVSDKTIQRHVAAILKHYGRTDRC